MDAEQIRAENEAAIMAGLAVRVLRTSNREIAAAILKQLAERGLLAERAEWVVMGTDEYGDDWIDIGGENDDEMSWTREQAEDAARKYSEVHGHRDAHVSRRFVTAWTEAEK